MHSTMDAATHTKRSSQNSLLNAFSHRIVCGESPLGRRALVQTQPDRWMHGISSLPASPRQYKSPAISHDDLFSANTPPTPTATTYTVRQENEPIFFCVHLFTTWQKLVNFFAYIRPRKSRLISYNFVYLILARVQRILQRQWYLTFYVYQSSNEIDEWLPASAYSFSFITAQNS